MTANWKHWICITCLSVTSFAATAATTPMLAAGGNASLFLNSDGSVWAAGGFGGPGATSPARVFQLSNAVAVASGWDGDFALLDDGTLWGMGTNEFGQLGDGTTLRRNEAQLVPGLPALTAVAAGHGSAYALAQDGTVWAWGRNDHGQLGDGTQNDRSVPALVLGLANVTRIAASSMSALALRADGSVWMWGWAAVGSAGDGVNVGPGDAAYNHLLPTQVLVPDQVTAISAGFLHHLVLRSDGTVWTWGKGGSGENGTGAAGLVEHLLAPLQVPGLDHVVAIDAKGTGFSLALKDDGTVWAWGANNIGQLGMSGSNYLTVPTQVSGLADIVAIAAGYEHVLARRSDGAVFAWGRNSDGQLGDNGLANRAAPAAVAGPGGTGQLNLVQPAPVNFNQLPRAGISLNLSSGVAPLTVAATTAYATDLDGTIRALNWTTSDGQQATGDVASFTFTQPGTFGITLLVVDDAGGSGKSYAQVVVAPEPAAAVQATPKVGMDDHSAIALSNDGRVLAWGHRWGLGFFDMSASPSEVATLPIANGISGAVDFSVAWGSRHVLLADGSVLGWGGNSNGQVGVGSQDSMIYYPQLLSNLPAVQALASAAGSTHTLVLSRDKRVFAWGYNAYGQLGVGDGIDRLAPTEVTGLNDVLALISGWRYSAALKTDGTVWAWGDNSFYQLGDGTRTASVRPKQVPGLSDITRIFPSYYSLFAQKADGTVWATGNLPFTLATNIPGQNAGAYRVPELDNALQIEGADGSIVVLKTDGTVWSGGRPTNAGVLGFRDAGEFAGLKQLHGITDAISVAKTMFGAMILRRDGTVLAWGLNDNGQLGDGTLAARLTPVLVVNETGDGFLDLIPGTEFEVPPSVGVPFFVVASGNVSSGKATVRTAAKFNGADVGKSGKVFVTARVPPGSLVAAPSSMNASGSVRAGSSAATSASSFVLLNLTTSGWQPAVAGQLIPYAAGVLGDLLSAQSILDNTDTTNLKGAQFCVGYGASAEEMTATGRMRVVASIPDPNASGAAAANCILVGPPVNYSLALSSGWSLLGNSLNQSLSVAALYNDVNAVTSVWKWDANLSGWQFYTPSMDAAALQTYAASKGYAVLATINPGEGYWVNAKSPPTIGTQSGDSFILTGMNLMKGWNLVATGNDITPTEFNANLKASAVPASLSTLWAWDATNAAWYFYAPSLEAQGGTALSGYITNKGYLDFGAAYKKLGNGTGFWVNR